jgi:hypothetical protein
MGCDPNEFNFAGYSSRDIMETVHRANSKNMTPRISNCTYEQYLDMVERVLSLSEYFQLEDQFIEDMYVKFTLCLLYLYFIKPQIDRLTKPLYHTPVDEGPIIRIENIFPQFGVTYYGIIHFIKTKKLYMLGIDSNDCEFVKFGEDQPNGHSLTKRLSLRELSGDVLPEELVETVIRIIIKKNTDPLI